MRPLALVLGPAILALGTAALADDATLAFGADVYLTNCAACHGEDATAGAPGDIRGLPHGTFIRALRGVEEMPSFEHLLPEEVEALAAWLGIALPAE